MLDVPVLAPSPGAWAVKKEHAALIFTEGPYSLPTHRTHTELGFMVLWAERHSALEWGLACC